MANADLIRLVDSISRDKNIDREMVYADIEMAMVSAARKAYNVEDEDVQVKIDRVSGDIQATVDGSPIEMTTLGRIAAQTAKQIMIQKIREAERGSIFEEYCERVGTIVTGTVSRFESGALLINLGRAEAILPRSEQIPGETHHPGERIRGMVLDVREEPYQVKIVLTRTHPDYIRRLFELEVPEVAERVIEIRALAREAGYRTKIAVSSIDSKVDAVGACVGVRGSRIRNIVDELGGEKIDIVRWNESSQILISNALKPAEIQEVALCFELGRAIVVVAEDQLSLAIGKRGQNVRLAARLTGWDIDILTPAEYNKNLDDMERILRGTEGVEDVLLDKLLAMGMVSLVDIEEVGTGPLIEELGLDEALAQKIVSIAAEGARRIAEEAKAAEEAGASKTAARAVLEAEAGEATPGNEAVLEAPAGQDTESGSANQENGETVGSGQATVGAAPAIQKPDEDAPSVEDDPDGSGGAEAPAEAAPIVSQSGPEVSGDSEKA